MASDPGASLDDDARLAARGDLEAFERVYRATSARVHALALRLVGRAEAEEATQEAYVRAWRKLATWRGEAGFATWLHRLSVNVCLSRLRSSERLGRSLEADAVRDVDAGTEPGRADASPHGDGGHGGDRGDGGDELRLDLEQAIERLPGGARAVFVLRDVEGLSHAEIAERLGVSVGTSKSQLHRARSLLRAWLGPREEFHG